MFLECKILFCPNLITFAQISLQVSQISPKSNQICAIKILLRDVASSPAHTTLFLR